MDNLTEAYLRGVDDYLNLWDLNPYPPGSIEYLQWLEGWMNTDFEYSNFESDD